MKLAAQYLRMSTDKQRYSIASQAALISEYAAARGYEIVASYEDAARSGVTIRKRDGLKALLSDLPLSFHPAATRVPAFVTLLSAV